MSRTTRTARSFGAFVGREVELELLKEAHSSSRGEGETAKRLVLVRGGAGVGKSVLLQEFGRFLRERNEHLFEGRCTPSLEQAYQPFAEIVTQVLESIDELGVAAAKLSDFVGRLEPLLPSRRSPTSAASKWQLYDAFLDFLVELGRVTPHTLFVHDLHYADPATLDLLRFLSENLSTHQALEHRDPSRYPGLVVVSSRQASGASDEALAEIARHPWTSEITLGGLGRTEVAQLLQTSPIVEQLYERSGGNPHHLEELLLSLPSQVEDLFLQRARRMPEVQRGVLGALAVLGRPAEATLVGRTAGYDRDEAAGALDLLCETRIAVRAVISGRVRYAFAKEIHQEKYYADLAPAERASCHLRAAEALEEIGEDAELLAFHFLRGGDRKRGPRHARAASAGLARAHAYGEAAALLEQSLPSLAGKARAETLSELADLYRSAGDYGKALFTLGREIRDLAEPARARPLRRVGQILTLKGSYAAAQRILKRSIAAAKRANNDEELAENRAALAEVQYLRGEYDEAERLCRTGLDQSPSDSLRVAMTNILGKVHLQREEFEAALSAFQRNLAVCAESQWVAEEAAAHNNRGIVFLRRGDYPRAEEAYREALAHFETLHDPSGRAFCQQNLGVLYHERADYARALDAYHRGLAGFKRVGNKTQLTNTAINLGNLYLSVGDLTRAERLISFALDVASELETPLLAAYGYNLLGETLCAQQRWDAARVYLDRAQSLFGKVGSRRLVAEVRLNLARLWMATGRTEKADLIVRKLEGIVFAERMPKVAGQTCLLRAQMCLEAGEVARAEEIYEWALELFVSDGDEEGSWRAHLGLARAAAARDRIVQAENHYLRARTTIEALAGRVPEDLRETYLSDALRKAALGELQAISKGDRLPARTAVRRDAARKAEPLFDAAATDLTEVRREFAGRRPGGVYEKIIGQSARLTSVLRLVDKVAPSSSSVLIRGESGTGKELIAEALHRASHRRVKPFVKVNCAALVETLLLSELFGHEKGAFTGAVSRRRGRFEVADGGTLFLDEIGDISPKTQVALLRVLQEKQFERVGGVTPLSVDVRIVCATNRDLAAMVRDGQFREDLYFRLKGIVIELPALRERTEDIPLLATHMLEKACAADNVPAMLFDEEAMEMLLSYSWPGNVRELENVVHGAVLFAEGRVIGKAELRQLREFGAEHIGVASSEATTGAAEDRMVEQVLREEVGLAEMKKRLELECIRRALQRTGGNITKAAKLLQMKRPRLSQIVKEHADLLRSDESDQ